jgi:type VI protein secretion system component Hcp
LRDCGLDIEGPPLVKEEDEETGTSQTTVTKGQDGKPIPPKLKSTTLKKRVDWASPQLFQRCLDAAMNSTVPPKPIRDDDTREPRTGVINFVTVDVCRPAGGEKVVGVQVIYEDVTITRYEISLSAPEPAENLTFEYKAVSYKFVSVDPYSGQLVKGGERETGRIKGLEGDEHSAAANSANAGGESTGDEGGGGTEAGGGTPSPATVPVGAPATPGAAPDPTVTVNFPGLWPGNGFGLLPH